MNAQSTLVTAALLTALAVPAWGQTAEPSKGSAHGAASIPNLTGSWNHPAFPWFEPPASGPGPITNRSRWPQMPQTMGGSAAVPPTKEGVSNYDRLVGDYTNPILRPWAAEVVKKFGEISQKGITYPNPSNQCWPEPMPFIYKQFLVLLIQKPDEVLLYYNGNGDIRHVRLNQPHRTPLTPAWYGDSVGHYEGDTLVIDTIGMNDRTFVDNYRTPHTEKLHVVERWKMIEGGTAMEASFTVDDPNTFYEPWSGVRRYRRVKQEMLEEVCAENNTQLFDYHIPIADKPDF